jgi:hypothetical protein
VVETLRWFCLEAAGAAAPVVPLLVVAALTAWVVISEPPPRAAVAAATPPTETDAERGSGSVRLPPQVLLEYGYAAGAP